MKKATMKKAALILGALLALVACGDKEASDAIGAEDNGANNPTSNNPANGASPPTLYGKPRLCERDSFSEPILCGSDADCEERLPVVAFGEYGCNPSNHTCTKVCTAAPCEGREGECQQVVPSVCSYGQPGDELDELTTNGQQCGIGHDCPPEHEGAPLLMCLQLQP